MYVAILQLLADGAGGLCGTGGLEADDFDQVWDAAEIIFVVGLGSKALDMDRDGGVGFFLLRISIPS